MCFHAKVVNPMVFIHRGQAFSAGLNGNYGGKTKIISDCWVNSQLRNAHESHKAWTICDLETQKLARPKCQQHQPTS